MSANHRPNVGDVLLNTKTRVPFKVLRVVSTNLVETKDISLTSEPIVVDTRKIERGLANGSIRRISTSVFDL